MIWKLLDATGLVTERRKGVSVEAVSFFCAVAGDSADLNLNAFSVEMTEAASNSQHRQLNLPRAIPKKRNE
jgi:hypothetical protein